MTATNYIERLAHSVVQVGGMRDVYWVESCPALDAQGEYLLRLSDMAGNTLEKTMDAKAVPMIAPEKVRQSDLFVRRQFCPLCGRKASESKRLFSIRQFFWNVEVVECRHCGMTYKDPIPQDWLLRQIYGPSYSHFVPCATESVTGLFRSRVRRLGKPNGRHLDYGCGVGLFVESALNQDWNSFGADPYLPDDGIPSGLIHRLYKADARDSSAISALGKFDCVTMWAVVEHLTSFYDTLAGIVGLLNPGGTIIFNSPNAHSFIARWSGSSWRMATLIEHLQFCTPSAADWLARAFDLKVRNLRIGGSPFPLGRSEGGFSGQGINALPFATWTLDEGSKATLGGSCRRPSRLATAGQAGCNLLRDTATASDWSAEALRRLTHLARTGDHIEVTLVAR